MPELDDYGRHEVMHWRWIFFCDNVSRHLMEQEQVENNPEWLKLAETAHQALFDLYQSIANAHLGAEGRQENGESSEV